MQEAKIQKEEVKQNDFELVKVATQHELVVQTPEGELITTEQAIVLMLNKLTRLERNLIGK